jgi:hypothetical protein
MSAAIEQSLYPSRMFSEDGSKKKYRRFSETADHPNNGDVGGNSAHR